MKIRSNQVIASSNMHPKNGKTVSKSNNVTKSNDIMQYIEKLSLKNSH